MMMSLENFLIIFIVFQFLQINYGLLHVTKHKQLSPRCSKLFVGTPLGSGEPTVKDYIGLAVDRVVDDKLNGLIEKIDQSFKEMRNENKEAMREIKEEVREMRNENKEEMREIKGEFKKQSDKFVEVEKKIDVSINTLRIVGSILGILGISNIGSFIDIIKRLIGL